MTIRTLVTTIIVLTAPVVAAQEAVDDQDQERFSFRIGAQLFTDFSTRLRVDSATLGRGTELVLEDDLSVENSLQIARLDGVYHFNQRHAIAASLYDIQRTGTRTISEDINFGDETFVFNTVVESDFEQSIFKLAYRYRFLDRPKFNMSASFGLHTMQFRTTLVVADGLQSQEADADAPLPVIGIQGAYRFSPKWRVVGSAEWFDIQSGDFHGTFLDALFSIEYDISDRYGVGFGFNRFELDVESGDENLKGAVILTFDAAVLYFKGGFGHR
jgi:hypothetical protein